MSGADQSLAGGRDGGEWRRMAANGGSRARARVGSGRRQRFGGTRAQATVEGLYPLEVELLGLDNRVRVLDIVHLRIFTISLISVRGLCRSWHQLKLTAKPVIRPPLVMRAGEGNPPGWARDSEMGAERGERNGLPALLAALAAAVAGPRTGSPRCPARASTRAPLGLPCGEAGLRAEPRESRCGSRVPISSRAHRRGGQRPRGRASRILLAAAVGIAMLAPSCAQQPAAPSKLDLSHFQYTSINASWSGTRTGPGAAASYDLRWRAAGAPDWTSGREFAAAESSFLVTGECAHAMSPRSAWYSMADIW